ncbi:formylglycine-generating enzyme family protein [Moorena sp. SIO3B2]|uniref:formylglycine-generating enzyme family protein n=1 Tax=Moorena sp. SIO3B2 TaxID=2607827 RepID=UPI0013C6B888|nr:formylglycine-generating enzyme family protein [Moorena sp. SIO3B2]NEP35179.1 formylglycine-generating enzyme family protein [Moorena sp. SIO3B2]
MVGKAIAILEQAGFDLTAREIAEILWLAIHLDEPIQESEESQQPLPQQQSQSSTVSQDQSQQSQQPSQASTVSQDQSQQPRNQTPDIQTDTQESPLPEVTKPGADVYLPSSKPNKTKESREAIPIKVPAAVALRNSLALGRALRPLMRKVPSAIETILDQEATVYQIAESKIWLPVLKPASERWLELALVVEKTSSTAVWKQTIIELQNLVKHHGAFRDVRTWELRITETKVNLFPQTSTGCYSSTPHPPQVLIDPKKQRLILLVSDCISVAWRRQLIHPVLELWGRNGLLTILQLLPERLWERTALGSETPVQLHSLSPGVVNSQFIVKPWDEDDIGLLSEVGNSVNVPVVTLEPYPLLVWSQVIAGQGNVSTVGFNFNVSENPQPQRRALDRKPSQPQLEAPVLVSRFRATASPMARRLAGLMAAAPVSLPVVQLIQQTLLPKSTQIHVAEVFMSGLLQSITPIDQDSNPDYIEYEFKPGIRELLVDSVPISKTISVIDKVSEFIAKKLGLSVKEFEARLLTPATTSNDWLDQKIRPFAHLKAQVLGRLGGEYARLAEELASARKKDFKQFSFEVVTVNRRGEIIKPENKQADYFTQDLRNGVDLEMVYIPAGRFLMGSPESERYSHDRERPQHQVTIQPFFLGKYPVTQTQWRAVAKLPKIKRDLDPDPSRFKGDNRPVEKVSWDDAVEFCDRLSYYTGTEYRLPSEAEWEYACRAGTTTPFHYRETITSKLANYNASYTYAEEAKGEYRGETTEVGDFPPNGFGLYDMHGNVLEWCADPTHDNYEGAPKDGSIWTKNNRNDYHSVRGCSWNDLPWYCRSASRLSYGPRDLIYGLVGFRVARGVGRN